MHGNGQGEEGAAFGTVPGLDVAVVQAAQHTGIIQADAGAVRFLTGLGLVVAFENLFQLVFRNAGAAVGHADAGPLGVLVRLREGEAAGGIGPDGPYPTPDIEEVKKTALMVYEMFGLELAIDFATSALGCSREEVIGWFPA